MYILDLQSRIEKRHGDIVNILPTSKSEGKNVEQITRDLGEQYSSATIRQDLKILVARGLVESDETRKPVIYWRARKK